jgi:uncharacterized protein
MLPSFARLNRRQFLRGTAGAAVAGTAAAGLYTWRIEPHWIEVVERPMAIRDLPPGLSGSRLVQISDLHVGPVVDETYITQAMERVVAMRPDAILITGDFMTCRAAEQAERTLQVVANLQPRKIPTFAILGNHDYGHLWSAQEAADQLSAGMKQMGLVVLRNEVADFRGLQIAGCDDWWADQCDVARTISQLDDRRGAIVMCHNPDVVDFPEWGGYEGWILSGHTHGGQCCVPGYGAPILPILNTRYASGEIALDGNRRLYVNRGLGYKRRVRFFSRPEITVFHLRAA